MKNLEKAQAFICNGCHGEIEDNMVSVGCSCAGKREIYLFFHDKCWEKVSAGHGDSCRSYLGVVS